MWCWSHHIFSLTFEPKGRWSKFVLKSTSETFEFETFTKLRCRYLLRQDWLRVNISDKKLPKYWSQKRTLQQASQDLRVSRMTNRKSHQITHILPQGATTYVMRDFLTTLWNLESSCGLRHSSRSPLTRIRNYWANQPCISLYIPLFCQKKCHVRLRSQVVDLLCTVLASRINENIYFFVQRGVTRWPHHVFMASWRLSPVQSWIGHAFARVHTPNEVNTQSWCPLTATMGWPWPQ